MAEGRGDLRERMPFRYFRLQLLRGAPLAERTRARLCACVRVRVQLSWGN